jgi:two-component system, LytTR family, sensor kinase
MLLQPLIENAVRHGVAPALEGGTIRIESRLAGARLHISVRNTGMSRTEATPAGDSANGIGIRNTAERLKTLYGDGHRFELQWPEQGGCAVAMELPFRRRERAQGAATCAC